MDYVKKVSPHNAIVPVIELAVDWIGSLDDVLILDIIPSEQHPGKYIAKAHVLHEGVRNHFEPTDGIPYWDVRNFFGPMLVDLLTRVNGPGCTISATIDLQNNLTIL